MRRPEKQTLPTEASPISLSTSGSNMSSRKGLKMPSKMREVDRRMIELRLLRQEKSKKGSWRGDLLPPLVGGAQMEFQLSGESLVTLHSHTDTNCSSLHYNFFNVLDDNVLDDNGSAKDKEDHNHDRAHKIADADNNVNNK